MLNYNTVLKLKLPRCISDNVEVNLMGSCNDWNCFNVGILKTNTKGFPSPSFGISGNYFFPVSRKDESVGIFPLLRSSRQLII